jgi:hypothetical protein
VVVVGGSLKMEETVIVGVLFRGICLGDEGRCSESTRAVALGKQARAALTSGRGSPY